MKQKKTKYSTHRLNKLAQRLSTGDEEAIQLIYKAYYHKLLCYGMQVAGFQNQNEVEDIIQDFFIWLSENQDKVAKITHFESYMFQAVRRNIITKLTQQVSIQSSIKKYRLQTECIQNSPEELQIHQEEMASRTSLIHEELNKLPKYQREVLNLRYFENKSYPEIASILDVSGQVAYNYVHRAIKRLKKHMLC